MKVKLDVKEDCVKGVDLRLTPTEFLLFNVALRNYHEMSPSVKDTMLSGEMLDDIDAQLRPKKTDKGESE